jgi:hypothetical protein
MPTLPTPGADYDSWGTELNEWLAEGGISFHSDGFSSIEDAIAATAAASGQLHLSPGTLVTSLNPATDITARLVGPGQIEDTNGDLRAPWFSAIGSPPSSYGNWGSVVSAFNGDLSKVQIAMEHRITGATTLTQPATGYNNNPEAAAINMFTYNESGWNQGTADSDGRTGGHGMYLTAYQAGLGDLFCITAHGFVSGTKPGSTSFVANAATGLLNGGTYAGADGVYLNTIEIGADDQTYDAAATGMVVNLHRRNSTGAKNAFWNGVRVQSGGTEPVDVGMMGYDGAGGFRVGLDLAAAGLETTGSWQYAAITMSANQRIYLDATPTDATIYRRPSSTGSTFIDYNSGLVRAVVAGVPSLQVSSTQVTAAVDFNAATLIMVNGTQIATTRRTGWGAPTGTPTRTTFATGSVTLPELAERVKALIDDLTTHGLIGT